VVCSHRLCAGGYFFCVFGELLLEKDGLCVNVVLLDSVCNDNLW